MITMVAQFSLHLKQELKTTRRQNKTKGSFSSIQSSFTMSTLRCSKVAAAVHQVMVMTAARDLPIPIHLKGTPRSS